jgi:glutaredoxin 3
MKAAGVEVTCLSAPGSHARPDPENPMQTVKIYTTGTCPYCIQAKQLLKQRGVTELDEIRVDMVPGERQKMMDITGRRTVPQIFIGETHVGGCDDLMALDGRGGLMPLLNNNA